MPSTLGKHYELGWLSDQGWSADSAGTFNSKKNVDKPNRIDPMAKLFSGLG
jgi:hypothetical protein